MRPDPLVSVVIPHYNRPAVLAETLQTVLAQTYSHWEVVIVDDCSPHDPTADLADFLADPRFRLIRLPTNGGASAARNAGVSHATGDVVAYLDSDDHWRPEKLHKQVQALMAAPDPERVLVTTQIEKRGAKATKFEPTRGVGEGETFAQYLFLNGGAAQTSSLMLSRGAAAQLPFNARLRQFEDYLFFIQAGALGLSHAYVPDPLVIWQNDERLDRLSWSALRNMQNAWLFLDAADGVLDARSRRMFLTNHVGAMYIHERPISASVQFVLAVAQGLLTPGHAIKIAANGLLPRGLATRLKRLPKRGA
jgi:glycosyltransferase involved in cell wall biosynthesis